MASSFRRLRRLFSAKRTSILGVGAQVIVLGFLLFLVSGFLRGTEAEILIGCWIRQFEISLVEFLVHHGWVHEKLAISVVKLAGFMLFLCGLVAVAAIVMRIPSYIGFLVISEFHRRQGHRMSGIELV